MKNIIIVISVIFLNISNLQAEIDNSGMKSIMRASKLIVYQNGCDFKSEAFSSKKSPCIKRPKKKTKGIYINVPEAYDNVYCPLCAFINVDYGYKDNKITVYLTNKKNNYEKKGLFYTTLKLKSDYKNMLYLNKNHKQVLKQGTGKYICLTINEILAEPSKSGIYDFYFTFRGEQSNTVKIELNLD